jgi:single-stranded-DNA-specific exonuclease
MDDESAERRFRAVLERMSSDQPVLVLSHNDADGLAAGALLVRGLRQVRSDVRIRLVGRGENPWSPAVMQDLAREPIGGLIVTDLGVRAEPVRPNTPTVLIDHHVPQGLPSDATVISGYGLEPTPTSSLLAYRCLEAVTDVSDLLWLAALGVIGDLGEKAPFAELTEARSRFGAKLLREATSLINAPRRSSSGDAGPALDLLMRVDHPREITSGQHPETAQLGEAKAEVKQAVDEARRIAPKFAGPVALILLNSLCQIHPLIAQSWTGRLRKNIVIAANTGYREGYVHFAVRSATGQNLITFLRDKAPPGAEDDEAYGNGHEQATGGALKVEAWRAFAANLGFPAIGI